MFEVIIVIAMPVTMLVMLTMLMMLSLVATTVVTREAHATTTPTIFVISIMCDGEHDDDRNDECDKLAACRS